MSCSKLRPAALAVKRSTCLVARVPTPPLLSPTPLTAPTARSTVSRFLRMNGVSRAFSTTTAPAAPTEAEIRAANHPPPEGLAKDAYVKSFAEYQRMHKLSLSDPTAFWGAMAKDNISWSKDFTTVQSGQHAYDTKWFEGGQLNASYNCVDRHALNPARRNKVAILWESDSGEDVRRITYGQLHEEVQRVANVLKSLGAKKGKTVTLYMPMTPEATIAMLACARIGAPHNVVFAGFSEDALRDRIKFSDSSIVITADQMMRGGKPIDLKKVVDAAVDQCPGVTNVLVVERTGSQINMKEGRDVWWGEAVAKASPVCPPEPMESEDPLFCLFTSGSTGKPKGLVHTTGGYLTFAAVSTKYAFDIKDSDVYACTADVGWITGHTYIVYGPLALGATTFLFEGHPSHPHEGRYWEMVQRHKISIFYTSPTAVRSLMRFGSDPVKKFDRSSLRILGSVGEPINPEAWQWLYSEVGENRAPLIDTYWQTESGGFLLCPLPGATTLRPSSATFPFFGIEPALLDPKTHNELPFVKGQESTGALVIKRSWPGIARTILGDHKRYRDVYFSSAENPNAYVTGDSARRDGDGYWWIIGRMDDVVNVSGHRIGSAEVEAALASHPSASESAVVSMPHPIKGEALFAFVTLKDGKKADAEFLKEVKLRVQHDIGKLAIPDHILPVEALPKTRSGKIMRRLLRQLVLQKTDAASLGDTSTLLDPSVVEVLKHQVAAELKNAKL